MLTLCVFSSDIHPCASIHHELLRSVFTWQGGGQLIPEDELLKAVWDFDWDERWLQCFIALAYAGIFILLAVYAGAKIRYIK